MRAAVLGHPVAHSLSPVLHTAAHAALGLRGWDYRRWDVTSEQLPGVIASLDPSWAGLSLTMPLKQDVLPLLDEVGDLAAAVGAVNTVVPARGRAGWRGENTDVPGLVAALREAGAGHPASAVVLGGGATAASSLAALGELGVEQPLVVVRSTRRAGPLVATAGALGLAPGLWAWPDSGGDTDALLAHLAAADVVIATTPAGSTDALAGALAGGPAPRGLLLDVVYAPRPTALVAAWRARGAPALDGTAMLLHQAGEQVRLMTGRPAPLAAMRAALEDALSAG